MTGTDKELLKRWMEFLPYFILRLDKDQEIEKKALIEYIQQYFTDKNTSSKTTVLKELEKETIAPEESPKGYVCYRLFR